MVADLIGMSGFFVFSGLLTAGAGLLVLPLREAPRDRSSGPQRLISRSSLLPTGTFMALAMAFSVLPAFLALYVKQADLGSTGLFFLLLGVALVPARWFGGSLADRLGRPAVIFPGLGLATAGMLLLAGAQNPAMLYASALIFGVGFGLGHTGLTILTVDRAKPEERGAAMATFSLAWDIGTLGSFALGFVGDAVGYPALFASAAVLPLIAMAGFQIARRNDPEPISPRPPVPA
ncbi:MAG: MFS transporter [Chloroflexi bacterium]|nr:MFS transporter [Chloroflexota bacterium]